MIPKKENDASKNMQKEKEILFFAKWKYIIAFIIIFAMLVAAYLLVQKMPSKTDVGTQDNNVPNEKIVSIPMLSVDVTAVSQITIQNQSIKDDIGDKTENPNTETKYTFVRGEGTWVVKNEPYIELHQDMVESLCSAAASLSADASIEESAIDLVQYGLETPQSEVTLTLLDREDITFLIGDQTPSANGYYAKLKDSHDVYMISLATGSHFCKPLSSFRVMTIAALGYFDIQNISIWKNGEELRLSYQDVPESAAPGTLANWYIESPITATADMNAVQSKLLEPFVMLIAESVAEDNPKDLSVYGFKGDRVELTTTTEIIRFEVGVANGMSYIMPEGKSTVYCMGSGALPFMEVTAMDVIQSMTNLVSLAELDSVQLELPGISATLSTKHEGEKIKYFVNDKSADDEAFRNLYIELIALSVDGLASVSEDVSEKTPAASIVYTMLDGSTTTLAYYPYNEFNYAVYENGECTYYIKKTKLSALAESVQAFAQNPNG